MEFHNSTGLLQIETLVKEASPGYGFNVTTEEVVGNVAANAHRLALTRFIVQRLLVPIVTSFGLVGNIISIFVFCQRSMISSTNCYLTALAVSDTLYLIFSFTLSLRHYDGCMESHAYIRWFPWGRVFTDISANVSVCLTVTFTLERYIGVCHPIKGRILCTPRRARLITLVVVCLTIGCTSPEFFEWTIVSDTENNVTYLDIAETAMGQSYSYQVGYHWFLVTLFTLLPLLLLCLFNGILVKSVLHATQVRQRMTYVSVNKTSGRHQVEQHKITLMLISVAVVFLVCQFPMAILLLYKSYIQINGVPMTTEKWNDIKIGGNVVNLLILVNASVNCLLYSAMSSKFRRVFLRLFCRWFPRLRRNFSKTDLSYLHTASARTQASSFRYMSKRVNNNTFRNGYYGRDSMRSCYLLHSVPRGGAGRGEYYRTKLFLREYVAKRDYTNGNSGATNNGVAWKPHKIEERHDEACTSTSSTPGDLRKSSSDSVRLCDCRNGKLELIQHGDVDDTRL